MLRRDGGEEMVDLHKSPKKSPNGSKQIHQSLQKEVKKRDPIKVEICCGDVLFDSSKCHWRGCAKRNCVRSQLNPPPVEQLQSKRVLKGHP